VIAVLHPGAMGSAVGATLRASGHEVAWTSEGRGATTARRARTRGLTEFKTLTSACRSCDVVISVVPPHAAEDVARRVAAVNFSGTYLDANAISPERARRVGEIVTSVGATFVDGAVIGPPPQSLGSTRLYLSGQGAQLIAALFDGSAIEPIVLDAGPTAASAIKMAFAGYIKGSSALLLLARSIASANGVSDPLLAEFKRNPCLALLTEDDALASPAAKAWRWHGEMEEVARTVNAAGLPDTMHRGAAQIYRFLEGRKDQVGLDANEVIADLLRDVPLNGEIGS
jgi:3-hydroxyisobutyrate dehydrogenase-like beta-hydroxyacid dehydrogenase